MNTQKGDLVKQLASILEPHNFSPRDIDGLMAIVKRELEKRRVERASEAARIAIQPRPWSPHLCNRPYADQIR